MKSIAALLLALTVLAAPSAAATPESVGIAQGAIRPAASSTDQVSVAWSPEGARIAYFQRRAAGSGTFNLFVKTLGASGDPTQLTADTDKVSAYQPPIWSADGNAVGFLDTDGFYKTISVAGTGSTTPAAITKTCFGGLSGRIAFEGKHYIVDSDNGDIVLRQISSAGTFVTLNPVRLTSFSGSVELGERRLAADYSKVLFGVNSGGASRLHVLTRVQDLIRSFATPPTSLASALITTLTSGTEFDSVGDLTADGTLTLVASTASSFSPGTGCLSNSQNAGSLFGSRDFNIAAVSTVPGGGRATVATLNTFANEVFPALSPDGMKLAFVRDENSVFQIFTTLLAYRATVPTSGGVRTVSDGSGSSVFLPDNALAVPTNLTINSPTTNPPSTGGLPSGVQPVRLLRQVSSSGGTSLSANAVVTLIYQPAAVSDLEESTLAAFRFNDLTQQWELVGGSVNAALRTVTFQTTELSASGTSSSVIFGLSGSAKGTTSSGGTTPTGGGSGGGDGGGCSLHLAGSGLPAGGVPSLLAMLAPLAWLVRRRSRRGR